MGWGSSSRSRSVDLTTSQKTTVTIRNSWVEVRAPTARPHSGQNLASSIRPLPQLGHVAMRVSIWTIRHGNRPAGDSSSKRLDRQEFGYSKRRPLARLWGRRPRVRSEVVAPERKRTARDYEQALKRQELATGRALVQALPADGSPGPRELDRFEAARNAVEEVAERWEGRRDQLGAELDRRQPHRRQGQGPRQGGQARGVRN